MSTSNILLLVTTLVIAVAILAADYLVVYRPRWRRQRRADHAAESLAKPSLAARGGLASGVESLKQTLSWRI